MSEFVQFLFSGLTVGAVYALVALGFTMIYNASGVVNFAQGEFVMLGALGTVFLAAGGVYLPLAMVIAVAGTTMVGICLYFFAIDTARNASPIALIIITIGASIFLRGSAQLLFDKRFHSLPSWFGDDPLPVFGAALLSQSIVVVTGAIVIFLCLYLFFSHTLHGRGVLAISTDALASWLVGINVRFVTAATFAISAAIGAIGGILVTPLTLMSYDAGTTLALKGFAAAMLGGMGSPLGAVVGALVVGIAESFSAGLISSQYKDAVAYFAILAVFVFRPQGLFGTAKIERV
ncbi:ABC transporter permease subunit [Agrobacterium tumefaciens]|uniref:ABC transporter permease subunit n=1 Tax=Agrobacterium tumefaciens TaxID=358 RepID=UPI00157358A5|nr:branched-chain amino acid ABC transporter permease [Agrobacterium tumefaciens]NTD11405.1 branched-chain amino acid ABC transporter permease [Agrobacterium tumefaciens]NTD86726.1 branched-chain amino acid ABC transporter permease [Agrobacterium tumefaciens]NTD91453.1 branched-chain amino acid ABC transporter permease [Agrobacterium tumefaciens]NTD96924.1 branched-chain amino acid ABC transporter permease [Agrobacterium tumefaciens]